ncbi:MAG TPA: N4-gp56 family major capsid protein [Opitutaceae bacterium]|nr:N4-gp56 family major capsid protein [Opitutaceae bacterium]
MATQTQSTLSNSYQGYFSKKLLDYAVPMLRLSEYATEADLPKNAGSLSISFFRPSAPTVANIQSLSEGTPISTFGNYTLTKIDATLAQIGEAAKITDIVQMTALFDALKQNVELFGHNCALKADTLIRNALNAETTGLTIRRAAGAADWATLNSDTTTSFCTATDLLDSRTKLIMNRAPSIGGEYVAVAPAEVTRDLMKDDDWLDASKYSAVKQLFKGEVGSLFGIRVVEATNPFVATGSATAADEYTYATAGTAGLAAGSKVFTTQILGKGAFGVPKLSGTQSPYKPQVIINDKPDKSDPLNQFITAGWKAYYVAVVLNTTFGIALKTKSRFAG